MTKVEKVLVKNVCVPLHDVIDARVAELSDRGCMGDEVCIWRNAEVLTERCHFPCSIINLPVHSADVITAYQQLMGEVFCDQYWERVGIHELDF